MPCRPAVVVSVCVVVLGLAAAMRQYLNPDELPSVKSMCDAQCEMLCLEIADKCQSMCKDNYKTYTWKLNCSNGGDCMHQGYCATLERYSKGYVPHKPIINVERDQLAQTLTVRWTTISSTHKIIYVLQSDQMASPTLLVNGPPTEVSSNPNTSWITVGWADSSYFIFHNFTNVCLRPKFRVAAVSRFGSRWFTEAVQTPELYPGRATNIQASSFRYVHNSPGEVYFDLTWDNPQGWKRGDVLLYHWSKGPSTCPDVQVFFENPRGSQSRLINLRIPEHGIGCTFNLQMEVVSRCNPNIRGPLTTFKFILDCHQIANYTCKPPVFNPPGNINDINLRVIPTNNGPLIQISWQPPTDLGSMGVIDKYHIKWGKLNQSTFDALLQVGSLYDTHNFTIPGKQLWTVIQLGKINSSDIYGVQIMPSAPGHDITYWRAPVHSMPTLPADWPQVTNDSTSHVPPPHIIKDDKGVIIVLVPMHPHPSVRLFLNMPEKQFADEVEGFAVQWGHTRHTKGSSHITMEVLNSTYITKNISTVDIENLHPKNDYGIKVVAVYRGSGAVQAEWDAAVVHVFTMPQPKPLKETTNSNGNNYNNAENHTKLQTVFISLSAVAAVILVSPMILYLVRKKRKKLLYLEDRSEAGSPYRHYIEQGPSGFRLDTSSLLPPSVTPDKWELPHSCLRFGQILGTGAFGNVVKGQITATMLLHRGVALPSSKDQDGINVTVAIKRLQEGCEDSYRVDFLQEIALMKSIGQHTNVVCMLGCCTLRDPVCLVVEHMPCGDLLLYLRNIRHTLLENESGCVGDENGKAVRLTTLDLLSFARQIAKGMEFLSNKGFVHRDLAARNVLVGEHNTAKIGDFGLTRYIYDDKVYVNRRGGKLPVKWMSIEAIFDRTYSTASDVWSFGIVLFEIVTFGGTPYPTSVNRDLLTQLCHGYRMDQPDNCPDELYQMMLNCWLENPRSRPDFTKLCLQIECMMETCTDRDYLNLQLDLNRDYYTVESESDEESVSQGDHECTNESHHDHEHHLAFMNEISEMVKENRSSLKLEAFVGHLETASKDAATPQPDSVRHSEILTDGRTGFKPCVIKGHPEVVKEDVSTLRYEGVTGEPDDVKGDVDIATEQPRGVKEGASHLKHGGQETDCCLDVGVSRQMLTTSENTGLCIIPTKENVQRVTSETRYPLKVYCGSEENIQRVTSETRYPLKVYCGSESVTDVPNIREHDKSDESDNNVVDNSKVIVSNMKNYAIPVSDESDTIMLDHIHLKQDVEPVTVSESSDSNIDQDLDDVFTDEEADNCECLYTVRPARGSLCEHISMSSEATHASQRESLSSTTSTQYLIPTSNTYIPRTESLVSTTSIDSGFPQSPVQREDNYVLGTRVCGKYKKAARTRLYSSSKVWHKLKRRHSIILVSECFPSMTE